jgi:hypothetical protein
MKIKMKINKKIDNNWNISIIYYQDILEITNNNTLLKLNWITIKEWENIQIDEENWIISYIQLAENDLSVLFKEKIDNIIFNWYRKYFFKTNIDTDLNITNLYLITKNWDQFIHSAENFVIYWKYKWKIISIEFFDKPNKWTILYINWKKILESVFNLDIEVRNGINILIWTNIGVISKDIDIFFKENGINY